MYPPSFVDELKNKIPISDLISKKLTLKSRGRDYVGLCPFHKEKTPSFTANDTRGFYHCFGCGVHGDIITFVMETEGLQFKEAIEKLAKEYGITLPKLEKSTKTDKEKKEIELLYDINEKTCQFFEDNLYKSKGNPGLNYARKRGLTDKDIKKFRIGFALNSFNVLKNHLEAQGFSKESLLNAGVIAKSDKGTYDKFRNRLMFPVIDKKGRVIAFTGRVIDNAMPKYMNSPETKIYHKSNVLFNYYFARRAIHNEQYAVLVEGNLDAISLHIGGVENVVAPMGTAITENQLLDLWRGTKEIVVCLDGDNAGQKACLRLSELVLPLINVDRNIKFALLPKDKDPDDLIREFGKKSLVELFNKALPLSEFLWTERFKELGIDGDLDIINPELKAKLEHKLLSIVEKIKDNSLQRHFKNFYKKRLWPINKRKKNKKLKSQLKPLLKEVISNHVSDRLVERIEKSENRIISLIIEFPIVLNRLFKEHNIDLYSIDLYKKENLLILNILEKFIDSKDFLRKDFLNDLEKQGLGDYIKYNNIICDKGNLSLMTEDRALIIINRLILDRNIALIEIELKNVASENSDLEKINILQEQLKKLRRERNLFDNKFDLI